MVEGIRHICKHVQVCARACCGAALSEKDGFRNIEIKDDVPRPYAAVAFHAGRPIAEIRVEVVVLTRRNVVRRTAVRRHRSGEEDIIKEL